MIKKVKIKLIKKKKNLNIIKFANLKKLPFKKSSEIYFSEAEPNTWSMWKFYEKRNQYLTVASGSVEFSCKEKLDDKKKIIILCSSGQPFALHIPKRHYYRFKCISKDKALIVNIIDEVIK